MMDAYGDQRDLARDLAYLHDLHHGNAPSSGGKARSRLLRHGSRIVIMPSRGNFVHASNGAARDRISPLDMKFLPFPPQSLYPNDKSLLGDDFAGLAFGFRTVWFHPPNPRRTSYDLLCVLAMGMPDEPQIVPHAFSVPREILGHHGAAGFVQAIMREVRAFEGEICLAELRSLPQHDAGLEYASKIMAGALLEFLGRINMERPTDARLDTVFLSRRNFLRLPVHHGGHGNPMTPHPDVLQVSGCTFIGHDGIPDDTAYFTSFKHGPALVRGPTVMRCEEGEVCIEHYSDSLRAQGGAAPDIPAGLAVRLVPAPAKGASQESRIPVEAEALDEFLAMARTLNRLGKHGLALSVIEMARRTNRDGVRTCLMWDMVLDRLGTGRDRLVASHNDLLVCIDRLIESGFAGGELLEARARVMRRLGLS